MEESLPGSKEIMKDVKNAFANTFFWVGVAVLTVAFYMSGQSYMSQLTELFDGYEGECGALWIEVFQYCVTVKNGMMFVPICAPLAAGACAEIELRSRYVMFYCSRIGKRNYYRKKLIECALPGGLMVSCSEILVLILVFAEFYKLSSPSSESGITGMLSVILLSLAEGFLNGALWASIGGATAVLARNKYIAYAIPFVMFYVLTTFQERYYRSLFFLSPKCWADPSYYGDVFCIVVLFGMCIICSGCFIITVKRRLDHV